MVRVVLKRIKPQTMVFMNVKTQRAVLELLKTSLNHIDSHTDISDGGLLLTDELREQRFYINEFVSNLSRVVDRNVGRL